MRHGDLPSLFCIGNPRSGSTQLYHILRQSPDAAMSATQEINFYSNNFDKGFDWYRSQFTTPGVRIDTSPTYFRYGGACARRIAEHVTDAPPKFVLILRNPLDAAVSLFKLRVRLYPDKIHTRTDSSGFRRYVEDTPHLLNELHYGRLLEEEWLTCFDLSQFLILSFDDFVGNLPGASARIFDFLELAPPPSLEIASWQQNRSARFPVWAYVEKRLRRNRMVRRALRPIARWELARKVHVAITRAPTESAMDDDTRKALIERFSGDVERLRGLIGRDKIAWRDFPA